MNKVDDTFSLPFDDLRHINTMSSAALESLRSANIFITGGSGLFGTWIIESLLFCNNLRELNLKLLVLARDKEKIYKRLPILKENPSVELIEGNIQNFEIKDSQKVTHILHLASESNVDLVESWSLDHLKSSVNGMQRILELAAKKNISGLLTTTSGAVYLTNQIYDRQRFVEEINSIDHLVSEKSVYGQSKRMMEVMSAVWSKTYGFNGTIARCFAFVGPYLPLDANYAVGNFIRDALSNKDIIVNGDGTPLRSYLYLSDMVIWILQILTRGETGLPYNVGGEQAISIAELANLVAQASENKVKVIIKEKPNLAVQPNAYLPSLQRANKFELRQTVQLREAITKTMDWYRHRI